jgi:hypothetical protein
MTISTTNKSLSNTSAERDKKGVSSVRSDDIGTAGAIYSCSVVTIAGGLLILTRMTVTSWYCRGVYRGKYVPPPPDYQPVSFARKI